MAVAATTAAEEVAANRWRLLTDASLRTLECRCRRLPERQLQSDMKVLCVCLIGSLAICFTLTPCLCTLLALTQSCAALCSQCCLFHTAACLCCLLALLSASHWLPDSHCSLPHTALLALLSVSLDRPSQRQGSRRVLCGYVPGCSAHSLVQGATPLRPQTALGTTQSTCQAEKGQGIEAVSSVSRAQCETGRQCEQSAETGSSVKQRVV